jgi:manganese transport protein
VYELVISKPAINEILGGLIPQKEIIQNPAMLYIAIGILGATVMPHNLYLAQQHCSDRDYERTQKVKKRLSNLQL